MGDATLVRTVYRTLLREGKVLDREPALKYLLLRPTLFLRSSAGAARSLAPIFAATRPTAKPQQVDTYSVVDELSTEFFGYKETLFYNPAIARQRSVVSFLTDVFHRHKDEPDQLKKERLIDAALVAIREIGRCVSAGKKYGIDTSLFGLKENTQQQQQHPQETGQQDSTDETASTTRMLQKGTVLIAHPNLEGDAFKRSAVLLYDYNTKSGAKGIILNNPFVDEGKLQTVASIIRHQLLYRDRANALKARRRGTLVEQSESENAEDEEDEDEDEDEEEGDDLEDEEEEAEQGDEEDNLVRLASEYGARPIQYGGPVPYQQPVNGHLFFLHSYSRHLPTPEGNNVKEAEQVVAKQQQTEEREREVEDEEEEEEEEARRGMASHQIKRILPGGVYCGGDPFRLSRNAWKNKEEKEEPADKNIHFFLGHSVWSPGQLEAEFKQGSWMLASLSPAMIFSVLQNTKNVTNDVERKRHRDGFWAKVLSQMEPEHSAMAKLVVSRPTEEK
ncbi:Suppressor of anucleate metulae protein B [Balamuthia mandrillaris]